jgi:hypothetical protein
MRLSHQLKKPESGKAIRIVPIRYGRMLCHPWRFFAQGNEVYVGGDHDLTLDFKISLHSSGLWKIDYRNSPRRHVLTNGVTLGNYTHAFQLMMLASAGPGLPDMARRKSATPLLAVPITTNQKIVLDVWFEHARPYEPLQVPSELNPNRFWQRRLPSGRTVIATCHVKPFSAQDRIQVDFFNRELRTTWSRPKEPGDVFVMWGLTVHKHTDGYNLLQAFQFDDEVVTIFPEKGPTDPRKR